MDQERSFHERDNCIRDRFSKQRSRTWDLASFPSGCLKNLVIRWSMTSLTFSNSEESYSHKSCSDYVNTIANANKLKVEYTEEGWLQNLREAKFQNLVEWWNLQRMEWWFYRLNWEDKNASKFWFLKFKVERTLGDCGFHVIQRKKMFQT